MSYSTVLELIGNELGPQYLAQEPAWGTRVQLGSGSREQGRAKGWPPLRGSYGKGSPEAAILSPGSLGAEGDDARTRKPCVPDTLGIILVPLWDALAR